MIVIRSIPTATNPQEALDFQKSLANNAHDKKNYCVIGPNDAPPAHATIIISLPDNCLVLNNSWDKYILHALENGLPKGDPNRPEAWTTWPNYVKKRLGLVDRRHSGIFPELEVEYPIATT